MILLGVVGIAGAAAGGGFFVLALLILLASVVVCAARKRSRCKNAPSSAEQPSNSSSGAITSPSHSCDNHVLCHHDIELVHNRAYFDATSHPNTMTCHPQDTTSKPIPVGTKHPHDSIKQNDNDDDRVSKGKIKGEFYSMPSYVNVLEKGIPIPTISNQSYGAVAQTSIDTEDDQEDDFYSKEEQTQYEVPNNMVYDYIDPRQQV